MSLDSTDGGKRFVCHIAIPCAELDEAQHFYADLLGCKTARRYDDRITFNFFDHQLVCHLSPEKIDPSPEIYPRHFGITFSRLEDYRSMLERAKANGVAFFTQPFTRFDGLRERHESFFLRDPANNLVEFKYTMIGK